MSWEYPLICDENSRDIKFGEQLMAGTRSDVKFYAALCKEVLDQIPESERRTEPCNPKEGGVDIHEATSTRNFNNSYTLYDFALGDFKFSVSQDVAERHLPKHIKRYGASN